MEAIGPMLGVVPVARKDFLAAMQYLALHNVELSVGGHKRILCPFGGGLALFGVVYLFGEQGIRHFVHVDAVFFDQLKIGLPAVLTVAVQWTDAAIHPPFGLAFAAAGATPADAP